MALLGIDLGGTKVSTAVFSSKGEVLYKEIIPLNNRKGAEAGSLITGQVSRFLNSAEFQTDKIVSVGICVPGYIIVKRESYGRQIYKGGKITLCLKK
jgi:glucokinase